MPGLVDGKVALVTGAGTGIGRASARLFAREGARVVVSDVNEETGRETVEIIAADGGEARFVRCDVADEAAVAALVADTVAAFGRLDCAHNNAGGPGAAGAFQDTALDDWRRVLAVNLDGVFLCMKHETAHMLERGGGGAIVNTASGAGVVAVPGLASYAAAKHAVLGLTKTAALELATTGIRVNAVLPGSTDTPALRAHMAQGPEIEKAILRSQPGGRLGQPEEIAEAVVWLCSDRASFVQGESLLVDGGAVAR